VHFIVKSICFIANTLVAFCATASLSDICSTDGVFSSSSLVASLFACAGANTGIPYFLDVKNKFSDIFEYWILFCLFYFLIIFFFIIFSCVSICLCLC